MGNVTELFERVIKVALAELRGDRVPVYTFALYHDHESAMVSVCVDTQEYSRKHILESNQWTLERFAGFIADGNIKDASRFRFDTGRSLSLGDFAHVGLAETDLDLGLETDDAFYLGMVRAILANQDEIVSLAQKPEEVVFCCSSADSEVGPVWGAFPKLESDRKPRRTDR